MRLHISQRPMKEITHALTQITARLDASIGNSQNSLAFLDFFYTATDRRRFT